MLPLLDFSEEQLADLHAVLPEAGRALDNCHKSCQALDRTFKEEFKKWFREPSESNQPTVKLLAWTVEQMRDRFHNSGNNLVVEFCDDWDIMQGDYGNVASFANRLARTESLPNKPARPASDLRETINSYYGFGNVAKIRLSTTTFYLPRTSKEELSQLVVFLHELSHWAAGTRDMKKASKAASSAGEEVLKCQGIESGIRWAADRGKYPDGVMRAAQNADNVAYFVASFI